MNEPQRGQFFGRRGADPLSRILGRPVRGLLKLYGKSTPRADLASADFANTRQRCMSTMVTASFALRGPQARKTTPCESLMIRLVNS